MRPRTIVLALTLLLGSVASALASDHLMKVNEILTSNGGSTTSQFIELQDPGELFPSSYSIEVFNAAGTSSVTQTIVVPAGTMRFLIATAQAQTDFPSAVAQATLTVSLPANGQACFKNSAARIHCFAWGTIGTAIQGVYGTESGPAPADGQSVQRTTAGYLLGTPTPGAANIPAPVVDGAPDAGVGGPDAASTPDAGGGNPPKDDGGCDVGGGASWFALIGLAALVVLRRSSTKRR